jgi:hypothetical protein
MKTKLHYRSFESGVDVVEFVDLDPRTYLLCVQTGLFMATQIDAAKRDFTTATVGQLASLGASKMAGGNALELALVEGLGRR